jgi:RimJ/RimL family protein N-acetyltransferase
VWLLTIISAVNWDLNIDMDSIISVSFWVIIVWLIILVFTIKFISHEKDKEDQKYLQQLAEENYDPVSEIWPISKLRLTSKEVELRPVTDFELSKLADKSVGKILKEDQQQWLEDWAIEDSPDYQLSMLQHGWRWKADWSVDDWLLELGVFFEKKLVGLMVLQSTNFSEDKTLETGIWLLEEARGKGVANQAKQIVLFFGFQNLQAEKFIADVHKANFKSLATNHNLNYCQIKQKSSNQVGKDIIRLQLNKNQWQNDCPVTVNNWRECKRLFIN